MISLNYKGKDKRINIELILQERVFHDSVFKVASIVMDKGDSLTVTYDLTYSGYTNGLKTSDIEESYSFTMNIKENRIVNYIRFTKIGKKAAIQVFEKEPVDYYKPEKFNAKKTKKPKFPKFA